MKTLRQVLKSWNNNYSELEKKYYKVTGAQLVTDPYNSFKKGPKRITKSACVLIGSYNSKDTLEKSLISIDESSFHKKYPHLLEVVVVDDGSTDDTREMIWNLDVNFRLKYILQDRGGLTKAHNTGLSFIENEIIIFSDSDMVHTMYAIEELMKRHEVLDNITLAGFRFDVAPEDPRIQIQNIRTKLHELIPEFSQDFRLSYPGKPGNICRVTNHWKDFGYDKVVLMANGAGYNLPGMIVGAFFSIKRDDFIKMGGSDERLVGWGCEDSLIGARSIGSGNYLIPVYSATSAHISHQRRESTEVDQFISNIRTTNMILNEPFEINTEHKIPENKNRVKDYFEKNVSISVQTHKMNLKTVSPLDSRENQYSTKAKYYYTLGFFDKALSFYDKAIEQSSDTFWLYFDKGKTLIELFRYEQALAAFLECLHQDSKNIWVHIELGLTYAAMGEYQKAQHVFENARNIDATNYDIQWILESTSEQHKKRGNHYANQGDHELAIKDFDLALLIDQNNCWALFDRGISLRCLGRYPEALQSLRKADQLLHEEDGNRTWIHTELGKTYFMLDNYNNAKIQLETALQLFPDNSQAIEYLDKLNHKLEKKNNLICHIPIIWKVKEIQGWFSDLEADLLIAAIIKIGKMTSVPPNQVSIVEIGSYCGKSTVVMGLSLKAIGNPRLTLFAIDPHEGYDISEVADSYQILKENLIRNNIEQVVQIVKAKSTEVKWEKPILLLFIDGLHDYVNVKQDFEHFQEFVVPEGIIAFHDYSPYFPDVKKFVHEILATGRFQYLSQRDSLILLKKLKDTTL